MKTENQYKNVSGSKFAIYFIFTIIMTFIALIITIVSVVRTAVTRENIYEFIKNTDYLTIKVADPNGYELTVNEMICSEFITDELHQNSIYQIIDQTGIENIASDYIYSYASFVLYGSVLDELTPRKVIKLFNKNIPKIEEGLGKKLIPEDIQNVENAVNAQKSLFDKFSEDGIKNYFGGLLGIIRFVFSAIGIIVFAVFAASLLILCSFAAKNPHIPMRITGIILLTISSPSIIILFLIVSGNFIVDISALTPASIIFQSAGGIFVPPCLKVMEYVMSAGVILILVSEILKTVIKSKTETETPELASV